MANERAVTCIICPKSCRIHAKIEGEEILELKGYECRRGIKYAETELIDPKRVLTTIVKLEGGKNRVLAVRTKEPIPKHLLHKAMLELKDLVAKHPVKVGDTLSQNLLDTGVDVIATANSG